MSLGCTVLVYSTKQNGSHDKVLTWAENWPVITRELNFRLGSK